MTTRQADPREWQVNGYYPTMTDDMKMGRQIAKLEHKNECARKISTLLGTWLWNVCLAGSCCLVVALVVALIMLIGSYLNLII